MNRRPLIPGVLAGLLLLVAPLHSAATEESPPAAAQPAKFSADQLDQMVAPVALYPDSLLIQILIASTYPLEVVEADRWRRQHANLKGDALDKALAEKDWDPSIEGLTQFPDLLKRMSENLDWTKDVGDAFLAQKDQVLDAVQRMRRRAQEAGTLQTTKEQTIIKEKETIRIVPAEPEVVYVPTYPPTAYGPAYAPPSPYYAPAVYGYTPGQMATASLLSFGVGVGVGALISDGCDWDDHDVHVNNNYYGGGGGGGGKGNQNVNVNVNKQNVNVNKQKWEHNAEHRRNVGYRDQSTAKRFEGADRTAARSRDQQTARGFESGQPRTRPTAAAAPRDRPAGGGGTAARPPADRTRGGDRQARATEGGRQGAFGGYGDGRATERSSGRGASSRGGKSWAGSSPSRQRAGGGGGGGRRGGGGGSGGRGGGGGGGGRR